MSTSMPVQLPSLSGPRSPAGAVRPRKYFASEVVMAQACDLTGSLPNWLCQTPLMNPGRRLASLHISQSAHPCNQVPLPTVGAVAMKRGDHQQNAAEPNEGVATLRKRTLIDADICNENAAAGYQIPKANLSAFWTPLVAKCRTAGGPVVASLKKSRYGLCQHPLTVPVQGDDAALAIETT